MSSRDSAAEVQLGSPQRRTWLILWMVLGVVGLAVVVLLFPIPRLTTIDNELGNLLHAPCFAVLATICCTGLRRVVLGRPFLVGMGVWLGLAMLGVVSEFLQGFVARSPSLHDALANMAGAGAGVLWTQSRAVRPAAVRYGLLAAGIALIAAASAEPSLAIHEHYQQSRALPTLASFERPRELQHWSVSESRVTRAQHPVSDGAWSMRLEMFPSQWPGAEMRPAGDWSDFQELVFDVWLAKLGGDVSPNDQKLNLIVKVSDEDHNWETEDRFHRIVRLLAGPKQTVRIPLADIRNAPAARKMDLSRIRQLQFFILRPKQARTIWLDNIHLD